MTPCHFFNFLPFYLFTFNPRASMTWIKNFIISLRPVQWSKNALVFAALIFSEHLFVLSDVLRAAVTFILFSLIAGWVYVVNDIRDLDGDRAHPLKRFRPMASGAISPLPVLVLSTALMVVSVTVSWLLSPMLTLVLSVYVLLNFLYSTWLKHVVVVDILIIAIGFVLRAVAGAFAIQVPISHWLLVCTFFLALFLVIGKRRNELATLGDDAETHRRILREYNEPFLDQMIAVVTGATILCYALYTVDDLTVQKFGTENLILTIPCVVYGIFRYFYLIYKKELGGAPEKVLLSDKSMLVNIFLWLVVVGVVVYVG